MYIRDRGLLAPARPGTSQANLTFPTVTVLHDGALLATWRGGASKDGDDETVYFARSHDLGQNWSAAWTPFGRGHTLDGVWGTLKLCYLTQLAPGRLLAAAMWVDRTTYPGQPLFNPTTEGCLPMSILLAESDDGGASWSPWRVVPMPAEIGPASLTSPVLKLANGALALSIETNKPYLDAGPWRQKVLFFHSHDQGRTWEPPLVAGEDPSGRIFNWDLRSAVVPDGRVVTFAWTYDSVTGQYRNIHRRISQDHGQSWSAPQDLGFADQAGRPAVLDYGRVLLPYVDRFDSRTIRACLAPAADAPFTAQHEIVLYSHAPTQTPAASDQSDTAARLTEMGLWTFGLPYAETLPTGEVLVVYYAGTEQAMDIHWVRLQP